MQTPITIQFQFANVADAAALLAQLNGHQLAGASLLNPVSEASAPAPKSEPARSKKSAAPAPADAPAPTTAEPTVAQPPAAAVAEPAPLGPPLSNVHEQNPQPTVAYADLQKAVLKLYAMDKAAASAIATEMGFASFKVMPAERWAEALAKVNAAIAARG